MDTGLAGVNTLAPGVATTPMISGVLLSVQQMLHDLQDVMQAMTTADPTAVKVALNALLDNSIANQLTRVVPLRYVEQQASQVGVFSLPVETGSLDVANLFTNSLGTVYTTQALKDALTTQFDPVVDPIATQVVPVLSDAFVLSFLHMADLDDATT